MSKKKEFDDFSDVASDEKFIRVQERFSHAEDRKKMFDKLSTDMEVRLKKEREGPRPALSRIERDMHHAEIAWKGSQQKLEDLKLQSKIHRAEIARAEEEFRHAIHKNVDLENPAKLKDTQMAAARRKFEAKIKRITTDIGKLEKTIPKLIQEELEQRGRLEQFKVQRESIKSGFHRFPIDRDPRMKSFLQERHRIEKEYGDVKVERDDVVRKVRSTKKRKQGRQTEKPSSRKRSTEKTSKSSTKKQNTKKGGSK